MNIFLNSKERISGTDVYNASFSNNFNHTFFNLEEDETLRVFCSRFSVLNDFENVNIYNNTFKIFYIKDDNTEYTENITIPIGFYNVYSFAEKIQQILLGVFESAFADGTVFSVNITYNEDTNKYSIVISGTGDLADPFFNLQQLDFKFDDINSTLAQFLGFKASNYSGTKTQSSNTVNYTWNSIETVDFVFQPELNIFMNIIKNNLESSTSGLKNTNLFFTLNQNASKNQYIEFINPNKLFIADCLDNFSTIDINIKDTLGRDILFNSNFSLTLTFEKIKKDKFKNNILEKINNIEKLNELSLLIKKY